MPEWVLSFGSAIIGGLVAAGVAFGAMRADLRNMRTDFQALREEHQRLIQKHDELDDKFVTRREYSATMKIIQGDIHSISESVGSIRDFLLTRLEKDEKSSEL